MSSFKGLIIDSVEQIPSTRMDEVIKVVDRHAPRDAVSAKVFIQTEYNDEGYEPKTGHLVYYNNEGDAMAPEDYENYITSGQYAFSKVFYDLLGDYSPHSNPVMEFDLNG